MARLAEATTAAGKSAVKSEFNQLKLRGVAGEAAEASVAILAGDRGTGKMAPAATRRSWWRKVAAQHYPKLAVAAQRLLSLQATTCAAERNWSLWAACTPRRAKDWRSAGLRS